MIENLVTTTDPLTLMNIATGIRITNAPSSNATNIYNGTVLLRAVADTDAVWYDALKLKATVI